MSATAIQEPVTGFFSQQEKAKADFWTRQQDKAKADGDGVDKAKGNSKAAKALTYVQGVLKKKDKLSHAKKKEFISQAARLVPLDFTLLREEMIKHLKMGARGFEEQVDAARPKQQSSESRISKVVMDTVCRKEADDVVYEFNKRYFVVENYGGKCRICWIDNDEKLGRYISHQSFPDFRNRYAHKVIQIGEKTIGGVTIPVKKDYAEVWLDSPVRHQYEKIVFNPCEKTPAEVYNLWQGFAYEPKQGECGLYLDHVRDNICRGNEEYFKWLVNWMAYAIQHPNEQGHSALVVFGKKGVGKNIWAETFSQLFGAHGMTVNDQKRVTGNFNNHLRDKCILVCDEAFFAGDPRQDRVLKSLVTSDTITIEAKGIDTVTVPNLLHVIILGNDKHLVRATYDERRYLVLECGDAQRNNQEYFGPLKKQLEQNGGAGYSALLFHLQNVDLTGFNVRKPPHTDELREQMQESTDGGMDVIREILFTGLLPCVLLDGGRINVNLNQVVGWAIKKRPEWARIKYNALRDVLGDRGLGFKTDRIAEFDGLPVRTRVWQLPDLMTCRRMWNEKYFSIQWPDDGNEWETTCANDVMGEG